MHLYVHSDLIFKKNQRKFVSPISFCQSNYHHDDGRFDNQIKILT